MAKTSPTGSPPKRPSITFSEKADVIDEPKQNVGGAFEDLGEEDEPDKSSVRSESSGFEPHEESTPVKTPTPPTSPPKDTQSVDSAPPTPDEAAQSYVPSPYTFRAREAFVHLKRINAKCPPFHLQLDHTLAVIWTLFSEEPPISLGVVQLQWALNFLKGIYTRRGEHPKDVALCILAIEELLMQRYAEMLADVADIEEEEKKKMRRRRYLSSEVSLKSKGSVCESDICLGKLGMEMDRNIVEETELVIKDMPFSVNYSDMSERADTDVDQLYSKQSRASTDASGLEFEIPQENAMEFLRQWRMDQISKIQAELQRLHSIETYIGCAETNFDNMDQAKLENIVGPDTATRKKPKN